MNIKVEIIDKVTQQTIAQKSLHFEQPMPTKYVLAAYMGRLFKLSGDPKYYVRVTKDDTTWEQDSLC